MTEYTGILIKVSAGDLNRVEDALADALRTIDNAQGMTPGGMSKQDTEFTRQDIERAYEALMEARKKGGC